MHLPRWHTCVGHKLWSPWPLSGSCEAHIGGLPCPASGWRRGRDWQLLPPSLHTPAPGPVFRRMEASSFCSALRLVSFIGALSLEEWLTLDIPVSEWMLLQNTGEHPRPRWERKAVKQGGTEPFVASKVRVYFKKTIASLGSFPCWEWYSWFSPVTVVRFYKVATNTELANPDLLLLGEDRARFPWGVVSTCINQTIYNLVLCASLFKDTLFYTYTCVYIHMYIYVCTYVVDSFTRT